jgi:isopenicillin N synthase-like dioxygenase
MIIYTPPAPADHIPVVDVRASFSSSLDARRSVAEAIHRACRDTGFFYVSNHGVPQAQLDAALDCARRFFDLPTEQKMAVDIRQSHNMRGYEAPQLQVLDEGSPPDLKEGFMSARELGADHPFVREKIPYEGANLWPEGLPGFRDQVLAYNASMVRLGRHLAACLALSLDLPEDYFASGLDEPSCTVRLLHYPPHPANAQPNQLGCGAHTDWGMLTFLLQDDCGGLEVRNAAGTWLRADPVPGTLVVNLADMLPRITSGLYNSTMHRVVNNVSGRDRYSVATFFNPNYTYRLDCVPSCRPDPFVPAPCTFGEHIQEMFQRTYGQSA